MNDGRFQRIFGRRRGTLQRPHANPIAKRDVDSDEQQSALDPANPLRQQTVRHEADDGRMTPSRAFPERHGSIVLLVAGIAAWLGAAAATVGGHDPVAVAAVPVGAALIGAAAYYSRVRKFAGVELEVLQEGARYEAPPGVTPTEAVQDFASRFADRLAQRTEPPTGPAMRQNRYFVHVDGVIPSGMVVRATWEATQDLAQHLRDEGWDVRQDVVIGGREIDLVGSRSGEQLLIEVKGIIYALNRSIIREIAELLPRREAGQDMRVRRVLFLPTPPLVVSPQALDDFRAHDLELWYADARASGGIARVA